MRASSWIAVAFVATGLLGLTIESLPAAGEPQITSTGERVALRNKDVCLEFDLSTGTYRVLGGRDWRPVICGTRMRINDWSSDQPAMHRSWKQRKVSGPLGKGLALDLSFSADNTPELLFSFILHEGLDAIVATAGIVNTGKNDLRVKDTSTCWQTETFIRILTSQRTSR